MSKGVIIMYLNENDFRQKKRSLRKYNMKSFKYFCFNFLKNKEFDTSEGPHVAYIPASKEFEFVYGKVKVHYTIQKGTMILEDLEPAQFLLDGYRKDLPQYRGMYYRDEKDKKRIDFIRSIS